MKGDFMKNEKQNILRVIPNVFNNSQVIEQPGACLEENVYSQMLQAYEKRLVARALKSATIKKEICTINEFFKFTNLYPWEWSAEDFDEWSYNLHSIRKNSEATQRHKQRTIARFQNFIIESPRLSDLCKENFQKKPILICSLNNIVPHKVEDENKDKRMPFTKEQLKCLWNHFDKEIYLAYKNNSKSLKILQRDKALYMIIYYYGLRANETSMLNTTDFIRNPDKPVWGELGGIVVRYGKSTSGSPPKHRIVWTISENPVECIRWYLQNIRPQFCFDDTDSLFVSERGVRLSPKSITRNFKEYLKAAGLPINNYSTHCLRHSYVSHLSENINISPRFIQEQVGHAYLATTQLYTTLPDIYIRKHLNKAIEKQISKLINTEDTKYDYNPTQQ